MVPPNGKKGNTPLPKDLASEDEAALLRRLLAGEARFRTIYENAPFMINSFDREGKVMLWNQACVDILGYSRAEVAQARDSLALFYPEEEQRNQVLAAITRADGQFREYKVRRRDGEFVYQMWANYALPDHDLISVGYDITGMREVQERLREANLNLEQKVEERTRQLDQERARLVSASKFAALGEMAGGIAHEINNPLAVIAGLAEQLQQLEAAGLADPKIREEMLGGIRNSVTRISKIIAGLRAISRDASRDPKVSFSAKRLIQDTLGFCGERFRNSNVQLGVRESAEDLLVEGRQTELGQVLLNLLNNAFDAVQPLRDKWVTVSVGAEEGGVSFRVTDSGTGVSPLVREKMFQPFFTTKPIGSGTGIGLSISKGIVDAHGGSIRYELFEGHTSFLVVLPRAQIAGPNQ